MAGKSPEDKSLDEKKVAAEKKAATAKREKSSFQFILQYPKRQTCTFIWGMICLTLGQTSDFVVPLYIGWVIDAIEEGNIEFVGRLCLQLLIIVLVSPYLLIALGLRSVCRFQSWYLQHHVREDCS